MLSSAVLGGVVMLCLGLIFWERLWSLELRELNDSLCMIAQRDDFYQGTEHRPFLEIDILNRLGMRVPSDILVKVDAHEADLSWHSQNWPESINTDQIAWHQEDMSEFYIQYQDVLSKRPNAPSVCDQAHLELDSTDWHLVKVQHSQGAVYVAARLGALSDRLFKFFSPSTVPLAVFLILLLVLFSAWFSKVISSPVKKLSRAMRQVDRNISDQQLQLHTSVPELNELVNSYNELLARMRKSLIQAQRFSADAAHELKTPLTILQGRIESALAMTSDISAQQLLASLQAEVSHLSSITRKLLLLSQADAGNLTLDKKEFDWSALVSSSLNDSHDLFDSLQVEASIDPSLRVSGDACLLLRLINNLLCNISKYALPHTPVHISSAQLNGWVETRFRNRSRPMSAAQRSCLFDRFYRVDGESSESNVGTGLGLSLAREIARAHGGDLVLEETAEDVFEFKLTLPAVQSAG